MIMSLPVIPISTQHVFTQNGLFLPWHIQGAGVATMGDSDTLEFYKGYKYDGYYGLVSVPLFYESVTINSFRVTGCVKGYTDTKTGAKISASLLAISYASGGQYSSHRCFGEITIDRINTVNPSNPFIDETKTGVLPGGFVVSASTDTLAIGLTGYGEGFASIHGLAIDFTCSIGLSAPNAPSGLRIK